MTKNIITDGGIDVTAYSASQENSDSDQIALLTK